MEDRSLMPAPVEGTSFKGVEWNTKGIEVLRIPADGSPYYKKKIDTIDVDKLLDHDDMDKTDGNALDIDQELGHDEPDRLLGDISYNDRDHSHDGIINNETALCENWVRHVPDIRKIGKGSVFDLKKRSLIITDILCEDDPKSSGKWCMYKCNEPTAGSRLEKAGKNPFFRGVKQARAFGDVYVFRLEDMAPDRFGRRKYAKKWCVPEDDIACQIFVALACCDGREEIGAEGVKSGEPSKQVKILLK